MKIKFIAKIIIVAALAVLQTSGNFEFNKEIDAKGQLRSLIVDPGNMSADKDGYGYVKVASTFDSHLGEEVYQLWHTSRGNPGVTYYVDSISGELYSTGNYNNGFTLGRKNDGTASEAYVFQPVEFDGEYTGEILDVQINQYSTVLFTSTGELWYTGNGAFNNVLGDVSFAPNVDVFHKYDEAAFDGKIVDMNSNYLSTLVLTDQGTLYFAGNLGGEYFGLAFGDKSSFTVAPNPDGKEVVRLWGDEAAYLLNEETSIIAKTIDGNYYGVGYGTYARSAGINQSGNSNGWKPVYQNPGTGVEVVPPNSIVDFKTYNSYITYALRTDGTIWITGAEDFGIANGTDGNTNFSSNVFLPFPDWGNDNIALFEGDVAGMVAKGTLTNKDVWVIGENYRDLGTVTPASTYVNPNCATGGPAVCILKGPTPLIREENYFNSTNWNKTENFIPQYLVGGWDESLAVDQDGFLRAAGYVSSANSMAYNTQAIFPPVTSGSTIRTQEFFPGSSDTQLNYNITTVQGQTNARINGEYKIYDTIYLASPTATYFNGNNPENDVNPEYVELGPIRGTDYAFDADGITQYDVFLNYTVYEYNKTTEEIGNAVAGYSGSFIVNTNILGLDTSTLPVGDYIIQMNRSTVNSEGETYKSREVFSEFSVNNPPVLTVPEFEEVLVANLGSYNELNGVTAIDTEDGDITNQVVTDVTIDGSTAPGIYNVTYTVEDSAGNIVSDSKTVLVNDGTFKAGDTLIIQAEDFEIRVSQVDIINSDDQVKIESGVKVYDKISGLEVSENISVTYGLPSYTNVIDVYPITLNPDNDPNANINIQGSVISGDTPVLTVPEFEEVLVADLGSYNELAGVSAIDTEDGDITNQVTTDVTIDGSTLAGYYIVNYDVVDSDGNTASESKSVLVNDGSYVVGNTTIIQAKSYEKLISAVDENDLTNDAKTSAEVKVYNKLDGVEITLTEPTTFSSIPQYVKEAGVYSLTFTVDSDTSATINVTGEITAGSPPVLNVNPEIVDINVGDAFDVMTGVTASDVEDGIITINSAIIASPSTLSTQVAGVYKIEYSVTDTDGNTAQASRTVVVNDGTYIIGTTKIISASEFFTLPSLVNTGDLQADAKTKAEVKVFDIETAEDITITETVTVMFGSPSYTNVEGDYPITFTVNSDASATTEIIGHVAQGNIPTITVVPEKVEINVGDIYDETQIRAGVSATDIEDDDALLTANIDLSITTIDTSVAGVYVVTYSVTDSDGNTATAKRLIVVNDGTFVIGDTYVLRAQDFSVQVGEGFPTLDTSDASVKSKAGVELYLVEDASQVSDLSIIDVDNGGYSDVPKIYNINFTITSDPSISKSIKGTVYTENIQIESGIFLEGNNIITTVTAVQNAIDGVTYTDLVEFVVNEGGVFAQSIDTLAELSPTIDVTEVQAKEGIYSVTITVANPDTQAIVTKVINVIVYPDGYVPSDTNPNVIADNLVINLGETYNIADHNAFAWDDQDGELTVDYAAIDPLTGVDNLTPGLYFVEFSATDTDSNNSSIIVYVLVNDGSYVVGDDYIIQAKNFTILPSDVDSSETAEKNIAQVLVFNKADGSDVTATTDVSVVDGGYQNVVGQYNLTFSVVDDLLATIDIIGDVIEGNPPIFTIPSQPRVINVGDTVDLESGVIVTDIEDNGKGYTYTFDPPTVNEIQIGYEVYNSSEEVATLETSVPGVFYVNYTATDLDGNTSSAKQIIIIDDGNFVFGNTYAIRAIDFEDIITNVPTTGIDGYADTKTELQVFEISTGVEVTSSVALTKTYGGLTNAFGVYPISYSVDGDGLAFANVRAVITDENTVIDVDVALSAKSFTTTTTDVINALDIEQFVIDNGMVKAYELDTGNEIVSPNLVLDVSAVSSLPGIYQIPITATHSLGSTSGEATKVIDVVVYPDDYTPSNTSPNVFADPVVINVGGTYSRADHNAWSYDDQDGDISSGIVWSGDTVNTVNPGIYIVIATSTDSDSNVGSYSTYVLVNDGSFTLGEKYIIRAIDFQDFAFNVPTTGIDTYADMKTELQVFDKQAGVDVTSTVALTKTYGGLTNAFGVYPISYSVDNDLLAVTVVNAIITDSNTVIDVDVALSAKSFTTTITDVTNALNIEQFVIDNGMVKAYELDTGNELVSPNLVLDVSAVSSLPGIYQVPITATHSLGSASGEATKVIDVVVYPDDYIPSDTSPNVFADPVILNVGDAYTTDLHNAWSYDDQDGDISSGVVFSGDTVDTLVAGMYFVTVTSTDSDSNVGSYSTYVLVNDGSYVVGVDYIIRAIDFEDIIANVPTTGIDAYADNKTELQVFDKKTGVDVTSTVALTKTYGGLTNAFGLYPISYSVDGDLLANTIVSAVIVDINTEVVTNVILRAVSFTTDESTIEAAFGNLEQFVIDNGMVKAYELDTDDEIVPPNLVVDTSNLTSVPGIKKVNITATHSDGIGSGQVSLEIDVVVYPDGYVPSTTAPNIFADPVIINVGDIYTTDLHNAWAYDNQDGNLTNSIEFIDSNLVDSSIAGIYPITVRVSDNDGNSVSLQTTVVVNDGTYVLGNSIIIRATSFEIRVGQVPELENDRKSTVIDPKYGNLELFKNDTGERLDTDVYLDSDAIYLFASGDDYLDPTLPVYGNVVGSYSVSILVEDSILPSGARLITELPDTVNGYVGAVMNVDVIAGNPPVIIVDNPIEVKPGDVVNIEDFFTVSDLEDDEEGLILTPNIAPNDLDTSTPGVKQIVVSVEDSDGNVTEKTLVFVVNDGSYVIGNDFIIRAEDYTIAIGEFDSSDSVILAQANVELYRALDGNLVDLEVDITYGNPVYTQEAGEYPLTFTVLGDDSATITITATVVGELSPTGTVNYFVIALLLLLIIGIVRISQYYKNKKVK